MRMFMTRQQLRELVEDAFQRGWCAGFAAEMQGMSEEGSEGAWKTNLPHLKAAQMITDAETDSRSPHQRQTLPASVSGMDPSQPPGGYQHGMN